MVRKERIEYQTVKEALIDRDGHGGFFFEQEGGKCFWFSYQHTPTEVMMGVPGAGVIGTFRNFAHVLI